MNQTLLRLPIFTLFALHLDASSQIIPLHELQHPLKNSLEPKSASKVHFQS